MWSSVARSHHDLFQSEGGKQNIKKNQSDSDLYYRSAIYKNASITFFQSVHDERLTSYLYDALIIIGVDPAKWT